jgi:hypothetical protein
LIHGVPYMVLLWVYARRHYRERPTVLASRIVAHGAVAFVGFVALLAFMEEGVWDQMIWHDRPWLFGDLHVDPGQAVRTLLVPLLAVPQATHYVLDGFIWRMGRSNPDLAAELAPAG